MATHNYLNDGEITREDIIHEIAHLVALRDYPITGWKYTLDPEPDTTLRDLAQMWADQEDECEPTDRMSFEAWLDAHINDGIVEPPAEEMVYYTLFEKTIMTEQRTIRAPKGMNLTEAKEWVEQNGDGDLNDIVDEESKILEIVDDNGTQLKEADND
ncbi:hypothetical protein [Bifidobacterium sp. SO1]|uniref:hypothetical protein n=1 Tax=Bifidobacterium sp. SO1 TaxID=2809029 RepID=UPI001BDC44A6|nr:hypothetical protein [Bifidobacterium sp. SO1]MBT1162192.1 hypothetical protein [Bifidobacterium sp. SO1]